MKIGSLVKHINYEHYGIVISVMTPERGRGKYCVVIWAGKTYTDWIWDDMLVEI